MSRQILCSCLLALAACIASVQAQVDIRITTTNGSYPSEMGWQIINTATNTTVHCWRPYSGTLPNNLTISVPAATYQVRTFDAFGDGWNNGTLTITAVAVGSQLWTGTYNGRERQSNVCPGPTTPLNAVNQNIGTFTVNVPCVPPTITAQPPTTVTSCSGLPLTLSVSSNMTSGTFEWFRDTISLGVTTVATLTIPSTTVADAGVYRCVLRDNCNPATATSTSASARVTIIGAPTITVTPSSPRVVCESGNDTLRLRATGGGRTFQWFKDGAAIAGATDSNFVILNAQATTAGNYTCTVSGTCTPSVSSAPIAVTVAIKPRITRQPTGLDVCPGTDNTISVAAVGNNLAYQWYKDGQPIPTQTSASISFNKYDYSMNGQYYCLVRSDIANPNNCVISVHSTTVRVAGFRVPVVSSQPKSVDACAGTATTLVGTYTGTGLTYQWFKDGQSLDGQTANALVISATQPSDAGKYVLVATGTCGLTRTSDTATITVLSRPGITKQPEAATLTVGERLNLLVEASDIRAIQWYKNDQAIKGATTASYSIASVVKADAGYYSARVTNGCGAVVSTIARVDVNDPVRPTPAITLAQQSVDFGDIPVGYTKSVSVPAMIKNTGNAPLTITAINLSPSDFTLSNAPGLPFDIAPGADRALTLVAAPAVRGRVNGTMSIRSNASATPTVTVSLSANYLMRYTHASSQSFGLIETGKTSEKCVTITNSSTQEITIDQATVTGLNAAEFSVVTPMPVSIAAGATADVCVKFAPGTVGKKTAQLQVRSANGGNSSVDLDGTAETPGGVVDAAEFGLTVGPNPMQNTLEIRFGKPTAGMQISLVDASGSTVYTMAHEAVDAGAVVRLNTGGTVASGSYMLTIRTGNDVVVVPVSVIK
ncbi:MAG: immunoglobulin domain-containing protein [Candidatus Kapaibacterium sp.]